MTNTIALCLGVVLMIGFAVDFARFDGANTVFLMRKLSELIRWIAFWR